MSESDIQFIKAALIRIEDRMFSEDGMCMKHDRAMENLKARTSSVSFLWVSFGGIVLVLLAIIASIIGK